MAAAKVTVEEVRRAQRAEGPATVLAIGTATPANCVYQADYPDYYFRITKSEYMVDLKEKFKRMCCRPSEKWGKTQKLCTVACKFITEMVAIASSEVTELL
ncbi:hypothetical protein ABZP36_008476 [Zizania latifolia]